MEPTYREAAAVPRRFFIGTNCHVCCINAENGEMVWQQRFQQAAGSTLVSLLHFKDLLFAACHGSVACLSTEGELRWQTNVSGLSEPAALALDPGVAGGQLLVGAGGKLFALSADEGKLQWTNELPGLGYHPICIRAPGLVAANATQYRSGKQTIQLENEQSS